MWLGFLKCGVLLLFGRPPSPVDRALQMVEVSCRMWEVDRTKNLWQGLAGVGTGLTYSKGRATVCP